MYEDPDFRGDSVTFRNEVRRSAGAWAERSHQQPRGRRQPGVGSVPRRQLRRRMPRVSRDDRRSPIRRLERSHFVDARRRVRARQQRNRGGVFGAIRERNANNRQSRLVLFDRPNFRGDARNVLNSATNLGGDRARSVQVYGGTWELCEGASRNARCVTVERERSRCAEPRIPERRDVRAGSRARTATAGGRRNW